MLFEFGHSINYSYSKPVFLEPHTVRLRPRCDSWQHLLDFDLQVYPLPAGISECIQLDGTSASLLWFEGLHEALSIKTHFRVETRFTNPFDYILDSAAQVLPMVYEDEVLPSLNPYISNLAAAPEVEAFAEGIGRETGWDTGSFLGTLSRRLMETMEQMVRPEGDPQLPSVTLSKRQGACRDLTVLFLEVCKAVGLAGRFVSGYYGGETEQAVRHLHAWPEVYLPGIGWRGYDPMFGLAVADQHIAVAAASTSSLAAPTSGTFRGTDATATMTSDVRMNLREANS